jgi:hypothetical protein
MGRHLGGPNEPIKIGGNTMTFANRQMLETNKISRGIRMDMERMINMPPEVPGMVNNILLESGLDLKEWLEKINTWDEFKLMCHTNQLHGWTKFTDFNILPLYFKNGLNLRLTAADIGYAMGANNTGGARPVGFRLSRINIKRPFLIINPFIQKGLIPMETIRNILDITKKRAAAETSVRRGKYFKYYAKWFVTSALEEPEYCINSLANYIGIDVETIKYWVNLTVKDVMVKPN